MVAGVQNLTTLSGTENVAVDAGGAVLAQASTSLFATLGAQVGLSGLTLTASLVGTELAAIGLSGTNGLTEKVSMQTIANLWSNNPLVDLGYITTSMTATGVYTLSKSSTIFVQTASSTTITVSLPAGPVNGQIAKFAFQQAVTALTITTGTQSPTVSGVTTSVLTNGPQTFRYTYDTAALTWYQSA